MATSTAELTCQVKSADLASPPDPVCRRAFVQILCPPHKSVLSALFMQCPVKNRRVRYELHVVSFVLAEANAQSRALCSKLMLLALHVHHLKSMHFGGICFAVKLLDAFAAHP